MQDKFNELDHKRILKFLLTGLANATISFGLLNALFYGVHTSKILSSIIATSCALIFSFIANRHYVFRATDHHIKKQAIPFIIVTVTGSLLVLNTIYILSIHALHNHEHIVASLIYNFSGVTLSNDFIAINLSTVAGAVIAMIWNYNGYRLFVFNHTSEVSKHEY